MLPERIVSKDIHCVVDVRVCIRYHYYICMKKIMFALYNYVPMTFVKYQSNY